MRWLLILFLASSCGAKFHLRQAERHLRKAEMLGAKVSKDTVFVDREWISPQIQFDTVVKQVNFIDTVIVTKDNVITKVKVNTVEKEIYIKTTCPPDTLRIEVPVQVNDNIDAGWPWWWLIVAGFIGLGIGALIMGRKK